MAGSEGFWVRYKQPGASESDEAREVNVRADGKDAAELDDADEDLRYSAAVVAFERREFLELLPTR
jgi:hypothetical protein